MIHLQAVILPNNYQFDNRKVQSQTPEAMPFMYRQSLRGTERVGCCRFRRVFKMVGPLVARARHPGQFHARRWPFFREQFCGVHLALVSKAHQKDSPRFIFISLTFCPFCSPHPVAPAGNFSPFSDSLNIAPRHPSGFVCADLGRGRWNGSGSSAGAPF